MPFKQREFHKEENCLNCGVPLIGKYCANCGQKAFLHKDSFWHMAAHFAGDYFHYDSKFWTTLKTLFTKPGLITLEYINGKRAKYINPIQLYVFVTTVFFLFTLSSSDDEPKKKKATAASTLSANTNTTDSSKHHIVDTSATSSDTSDANKTHINLGFEEWGGKQESVEKYDSVQKSLPEYKRNSFLKDYFIRKYYNLHEKYDDDKELLTAIGKHFVHNIPKIFFILLPVFALLLMLVFLRKKIYYVDHIIFSIHFHSYLFILLGITMFINHFVDIEIVDIILPFAFIFTVGGYLYFSLKKVYPSSGFKIFLKQVFLFFSYLLAFIFASLILLLFTFCTM